DRFLFILVNRRLDKSERGTTICWFRRPLRVWIYNCEVSDRHYKYRGSSESQIQFDFCKV
ncbi:MAG: hypothetical protein AB1589_39525, partial [Cyanobacteriota bacterium]